MQYPVRTEFRAVGSFLACWILLLTLPGSVDAKPFDSLPSPAAVAEVLGIDIAHEKTTAVERDSSPNVIIILVDDMGYGSASAYGGDIPTPNLERLAREGARFTDGYSISSICFYARAGLLTGKQPSSLSYKIDSGRVPWHKYRLHPEEKTLADFFSELGYSTGVIGKWHLGSDVDYQPDPKSLGFEEFSIYERNCRKYKKQNIDLPHEFSESIKSQKYFCSDEIAMTASRFIFQHRRVPFFLYLSTHAPHGPWPNLEKSFFKNLSYYLIPGYLRRTSVAKGYFQSLVHLDKTVGHVLDTIDFLGLSKNTLIWFLSDNGIPINVSKYPQVLWARGHQLRDYKGSLYEGGIRVPFMARWTGTVLPGVYEWPVQSLDILPTSLAAAGRGSPLSETESPYVTEYVGRNILPYLKNPSVPPDRYLYWIRDRKKKVTHKDYDVVESAVRFGDWKLISFEVQGQVLDRELYNLREDVQEKNNLLRVSLRVEDFLRVEDLFRTPEVVDVFLDLNGRLDAATEFFLRPGTIGNSDR